MTKPKAITLQQKLGFFDEDLKKPDHDTILKWIDTNIETVIDSIYNFKDWDENIVKTISDKVNDIVIIDLECEKNKFLVIKDKIDKNQSKILELNDKLLKEIEIEEIEKRTYFNSKWTKEDIDKIELDIKEKEKELEISERKLQYLSGFKGISVELPQRQKPRIVNKKWEYAVTSQSINQRTGYESAKNIIGYIDMKVVLIYTNLTVIGVDFSKNKVNNKIEWAQTEKTGFNNETNYKDLLIEVKTKIQSLGELFRQLNTYKEFEKGDYLVVCPDDSNEETIISQGFKFYKFK
jgi:hypothetical protein